MVDFQTLPFYDPLTGTPETLLILKVIMNYIALAASLFATPSFAEDFVVASYTAYISGNDLTNSSGTRLGDAASVIRQDRANFHRFGLADKSDESNPLFNDSFARSAIPDLIRSAGGMDSAVAAQIMRGNVQVHITILSDGDDFTGIEVSILG